MKHIFLTFYFSFMLASCGSFVIGENSFACDKDNPLAGEECHSARDMYKLTNNNQNPVGKARQQQKQKKTKLKRHIAVNDINKGNLANNNLDSQTLESNTDQKRTKVKTEKNLKTGKVSKIDPIDSAGARQADKPDLVGDSVIQNYVTPNIPNYPVPVRTPASVMRIWFATWEDTSGDLIAPGYVYSEIEPRRWTIGNTDEPQNTSVFSPLLSK